MNPNQNTYIQNIGPCVKDVKTLSEMIRKDLTLANEKDRSIGVLFEDLSTNCDHSAQNQLSALEATLKGFATTLARTELCRKALYQRIRPLGETFLIVSSRNTQKILSSIQKRDNAFKKVTNLPRVENDPRIAEHNSMRQAAYSANAEVEQEVKLWYGTYNADMKKALREYAHAQMEFAAKALEQWSSFVESITYLDFNKDTEAIVNMLEQGAIDVQNM